MSNRNFSSGQLNIKFVLNTPMPEMTKILTEEGIEPELGRFYQITSTWFLKVPKGKELELAERFKKHKLVVSAELNYW